MTEHRDPLNGPIRSFPISGGLPSVLAWAEKRAFYRLFEHHLARMMPDRWSFRNAVAGEMRAAGHSLYETGYFFTDRNGHKYGPYVVSSPAGVHPRVCAQKLLYEELLPDYMIQRYLLS